MPSVFTEILAGRARGWKIAEDAHHAAFLEQRPLVRGHAIVVPKKETDYLFDLPDAELAALHVFAKKVARGLAAAFPCKKVALLCYGIQVRHVHLHLVPAQGVAGELDFTNAKSIPDAELDAAAAAIRPFLSV